jgi:hypothetical protein
MPENVAAKLRYLVIVCLFAIEFDSSEAFRIEIENTNAIRLKINGKRKNVQKKRVTLRIDHNK